MFYVAIHNPISGMTVPFRVPDVDAPQPLDLDSLPPTKLLLFTEEDEARIFCAKRGSDLGFIKTGLRYICLPLDGLPVERREDEATRDQRQKKAKARVEKVMQMSKRRRR